jgi:hypothetical protein
VSAVVGSRPPAARRALAGYRDIDVTIAPVPRGLAIDRRRAREWSRYLRYGVGMRLGLLVAAVLASGCGADDGAAGGDTDDYLDMDTPPGNCSAGTAAEPCPDPGSSGVPEGEPCNSSQQCAVGNACVAPFVDGEAGQFVCAWQCVELGDESQWCLDASACCEPGAVCSARGLCIAGGLDDSGTGSGTAGDGTVGTGTDGSGSSSSGEAGTTTESTGSATGTTGLQ